MSNHLAAIETFIRRLDPATHAALEGILHRTTYPKGAYLLQQGDICRHIFLIEHGAVRKFYLWDGREVTTELIFAGDIAVAMKSYTLQQASEEYIQAIAATEVWAMPYTPFQALKAQYPRLVELDLMLTEHYAMWLEDRLFDFHTLDATQRYQKLLLEQPHVIQQTPLTYIAAYLGISLETLSRIRAKI
jgi:CRP-like cAMP-binding protein